MDAKSVYFTTDKAGKILKWKVKEGMVVSARQVILLYDEVGQDTTEHLKFKSTQVGTVRKRIAQEGDIVHPGAILLELDECSHPTVMKDMCAECGADLRKEEQVPSNASVPMVHSIPELKVSQEQAQRIGKADETRLIGSRKLVLLVDLDQTLIHTTNDNIPPNLKDVYHFQLCGPASPWYHTRIRPHTQEFLQKISNLYELHICTFGARNYAHTIAMFLDPDGKFFSHRILSRDECFNANSKTANLKALFPCGDNMVCIIDDREDVWNFASNLIHVKPYHFFKHTGDINAPPGLAKDENDDIDGYDFSVLEKEKATGQETKETSEKDKDKRSSKVISKVKELGESTTDKDTEDENEKKQVKVKTEEKPLQLEKVNCDLQLSEEDSDEENKSAQKALQGDNISSSAQKSAQKTVQGDSVNGSAEKPEQQSVQGASVNGSADDIDKTAIAEETNMDTNVEDAHGEKKVEVGTVIEDQKTGTDEVKDETEKSKNMEEEKTEGTEQKKEEDLIEIEDNDDYLLYLGDILKKIHNVYYTSYDQQLGQQQQQEEKALPSCSIPDLKLVVPEVKGSVLQGCHLVFSRLIPSHVSLEQSRAYLVALALGATVSQDLTATSTHLVAASPGTAKVNSARRQKGVHTVTPLWLWGCAERWERLDERLFPLGRGNVSSRHPPAHCGSPSHSPQHETETYSPAMRERTLSGRFIDTINPLLTFSSEDMKMMDKEVAELFKEDDDTDSDDKEEATVIVKTPLVPKMAESSTNSSSEDSLSGATHPKGWSEEKSKSKKRKMETTTCTESDNEEESPSVKFRRGEPLPSDLDFGEESQDSPGSEEPLEDVDDGDWNMMGEVLEREFLSRD